MYIGMGECFAGPGFFFKVNNLDSFEGKASSRDDHHQETIGMDKKAKY
jgi:hypothetical protein